MLTSFYNQQLDGSPPNPVVEWRFSMVPIKFAQVKFTTENIHSGYHMETSQIYYNRNSPRSPEALLAAIHT
jgi:hypothetical protein